MIKEAILTAHRRQGEHWLRREAARLGIPAADKLSFDELSEAVGRARVAEGDACDHVGDIMRRAQRAYRGRCRRENASPQQPSRQLSSFDGEVVRLANVNGTFARYRWTGKRLVPLAA